MFTSNLGHLTNDDLRGFDAIDLAASNHAERVVDAAFDAYDLSAQSRPARVARDYSIFMNEGHSHAF